MCGLFGYAGLYPAKLESLLHVAELASTRGPHSHGWTFVNRHQQFAGYRAPGPLSESLDTLRFVAETYEPKCIIGHSRLATTGTYAGGDPKIDDTMPFLSGRVAVVHNGNVRDYVRIAREWKIDLDTGCDSEVVAHILDRHRAVAPDLHTAMKSTIQAIDDARPFALIAITEDLEIVGAHRELPLYVANADEGTYFCSRRPVIAGATVAMAPPIWSWPTAHRAVDVA